MHKIYTLALIVCCLTALTIAAPLKRSRRQLNAARVHTGQGQYMNQIRLEHDQLFGQVSQNFDRHGNSGPKQYLLGGKYDPNEYIEVYFGLDEIPHYEKISNLGFKVHRNNIEANLQHTRSMNGNWGKESETNTGSIGYNNPNRGSVSVATIKTPGQPTIGIVSGNVPLYQGGNVNVDLSGSRTFVPGNPPNDQVNLQISGTIPK